MADSTTANADEIIGVSICSNCQKRFRISRKHEAMVGKTVRCPACREPFLVKLVVPSQVEQAAIRNVEQKEEQENKQKRARRSKGEIREGMVERIRKNLGTLHKRLEEIVEQESSEEQVRVWCIDVLKTVLEYDSSNIDTEVRAIGQRIDIALKEDDHIFLIIECKKPSSKLPAAVRDQAVMYAANKSADWAVACNGPIWKLWRVIPKKGKDPTVVPVFDISLLDEDGISEADIANFYLLTKRALFNGETLAEFHRQEAASNERILAALKSERVVTAMKKVLMEEYQEETGERIKLSDEFMECRLEDMFLPEEL